MKVFEGTPQEYYMDGYLHTALSTAKKVIQKDWDMIFEVDGGEGCLTGDTLIQVSRGKLSRKYSLKRLYNHYNNNPDKIISDKKIFNLNTPSYIRCFNGKEIRLHQLKKVTYSGEKKVYQLTTENGYQIKATADHKFLTRDGWKELQHLVLSQDEIMCDTLHPQKNNRKRIKLKDICLAVMYHPYKNNSRHEVEVHRLIYEAHLNKLPFLTFLDILLNEPTKAKELKYIDPGEYHIHHIDYCHYNNNINNLKLMPISEHLKFHSKDAYSNFSQGIPVFFKVIKITELGIEPTYDIQCCEPHHNFVANGIIVHNSGKSVIAMQMAYFCDPTLTNDRIVFNPTSFKKAILSAKPYQAVIYDEAYTGLSSRATMSLINRTLISMLAEIRQKNLFVFVVMPCFFDLDKYVSLWRSRALIHVYTGKNFERGFFAFYNTDRKKDLYILGKKFYNYYKPKPNFIGRFTDHYTVDKEEYKQNKRTSLTDREKVIEDEELKKKVDELLFERVMALDILTEETKMKILKEARATYFRKKKKIKSKELNDY